MPSQPLVLLVDDSSKILLFLEDLLHASGCRTISCTDGAEAIDTAVRIVPDLILLDLRLPTLDGYSVLGSLRAEPRTQKVPVIVLSGNDVVSEVDKAFANGANDYILKPYDNHLLLGKIRKHLPQLV